MCLCANFFFLLIIKCAPSVLCVPPAVLVRKYERLGLSNVHDLGDVSIARSIPADFTNRVLVMSTVVRDSKLDLPPTDFIRILEGRQHVGGVQVGVRSFF
jgi:hypothetical protein